VIRRRPTATARAETPSGGSPAGFRAVGLCGRSPRGMPRTCLAAARGSLEGFAGQGGRPWLTFAGIRPYSGGGRLGCRLSVWPLSPCRGPAVRPFPQPSPN
jgi:hypothetical protein